MRSSKFGGDKTHPSLLSLSPHPPPPPPKKKKKKKKKKKIEQTYIVRLSLLTITNPNQLCDVLLFVCSKMTGETNLSFKLSVADRTREVWGRKLCWCSGSGFPLCTFLLGFADSFCFVFTSSPSHEASPLCSILCNLFPWLCWYVEIFKGGFGYPCIASSDHHGSVFQLIVLHRRFSLANVHQAFW